MASPGTPAPAPARRLLVVEDDATVRQLLEQVLYELRLRFVDASKPQSRIITP